MTTRFAAQRYQTVVSAAAAVGDTVIHVELPVPASQEWAVSQIWIKDILTTGATDNQIAVVSDNTFVSGSLLGAAMTDSATVATVDDSDDFEAGMIIKIGDEEMWLVSATLGGTAIVIIRGVGGTTAAAHSNNDPISILAPLWHEGNTLHLVDVDGEIILDLMARYNAASYIQSSIKVYTRIITTLGGGIQEQLRARVSAIEATALT